MLKKKNPRITPVEIKGYKRNKKKLREDAQIKVANNYLKYNQTGLKID